MNKEVDAQKSDARECPGGAELITEETRVTKDSDGLSAADIKHNMLVIIMLDAIFMMGYNDFYMVMQPLLVYLKASNTLIGIVMGAGSIAVLGVFISPWISVRFRLKKWYLFIAHIPYLGALAIIGITVALSHHLGLQDSKLLVIVVLLTFLHWLFAGFVALPHQEYVAACIPLSHRGRYAGWSFAVGGGLSMISAAIGYWILRRYSEPMAFGYVILMAWAIAQGSYLLALLGRERPTPVEKAPRPWSKSMLKAFWNDKIYVQFMLVSSLNYVLVGAVSVFISVYGYKELGMVLASAAVFQIISQGMKLGFSGYAGHITDRIGAKRMYPYWYIVSAIAFLTAALMHNRYGVYLSLLIYAIFQTGIAPAQTALNYGLPKPENRSGHYAIQLILFYAAGTTGTILTGKLCDILPYRVVFTIAIFSSLALFAYSKYILSELKEGTME